MAQLPQPLLNNGETTMANHKKLPLSDARRKFYTITELAKVLRRTTIEAAVLLDQQKIRPARMMGLPSGNRRALYNRAAYEAAVAYRAERDAERAALTAIAGTPAVIPVEAPAPQEPVQKALQDMAENAQELGLNDHYMSPSSIERRLSTIEETLAQISKKLDDLAHGGGLPAFKFDDEPVAPFPNGRAR
jgi:nucleoid-associated protein YgaU